MKQENFSKAMRGSGWENFENPPCNTKLLSHDGPRIKENQAIAIVSADI